MEHGAVEHVEEQSQVDGTIKIEMEETRLPAEYIEIEMNSKCYKEELELGEAAIPAITLSVKEEILDYSLKASVSDMMPITTEGVNAAPDVQNQCNVFNIKEGLGGTELNFKPALYEYADIDYSNDQQNTSVVKERSAIIDYGDDPILGNRLKGVQAKWRGSLTPQASLMEHPGTGTTMHSLRIQEERLDSICKMQLRRLDTFESDVVSTQSNPQMSQQCATNAQHSKEVTQPKQQAQYRLYRCDKCPKMYKFKSVLEAHSRRIHGTESLVCAECNVECKCKEYLARHIRNVHGKQQFECTVCMKMCKSKEALRRHVCYGRKPAGSQPRKYICDFCQKTFTLKSSITNHMTRVHARGSYKCNQCNKCFKCEQYLISHVAIVHSDNKRLNNLHGQSAGSERRIYICHYCQKTFTVKSSIINHITRVHASGSYKCNLCNKCFKCEQYLLRHTADVHTTHMQMCNLCGKSVRPRHLRYHMRNMHSDKPMHCKLCGETMKTKEFLHQHLNEFHGQQSEVSPSAVYKCDYCQKTYHIKYSLVVHLDSVHGNTSHRCAECKMDLKSKHYLQRHIKMVHSKEAHECAFCKKIFTTKQYYSRHVRLVHASEHSVSHEQIYPCNYCQKTFWRKPALLRHVKGVHEVRIHRCRQCNKIFKSRNHLQKHKTSIHGKVQHECEVCQTLHRSRYMLKVHLKKAHSLKGGEIKYDLRPRVISEPFAGDVSAVASSSTR